MVNPERETAVPHFPDDEAHRRYRAEWNTRRVEPVR